MLWSQVEDEVAEAITLAASEECLFLDEPASRRMARAAVTAINALHIEALASVLDGLQ